MHRRILIVAEDAFVRDLIRLSLVGLGAEVRCVTDCEGMRALCRRVTFDLIIVMQAAMFLCGFGWAKPVPVDMRYFKHPRAGMAVTALAGPASNFLLALGALFLASLIFRMAAVGPVLAWLFCFLLSTAMLSVGLGLFNLIPIPPLDGSKVLFALLPDRAYYVLMRYERYGMLLLMALIWLDLGGSFLSNAIAAVFQWMVGLFFAH